VWLRSALSISCNGAAGSATKVGGLPPILPFLQITFQSGWDLEKRARMARSDEAGAIWEIGRNLRLWTILLMPHSGIVSSNAAVPPTLF
jgi:hypothetical protein